VLARPRFIRGDDDIGYLLRVLRNTFLNTRRTKSRRPQTVAIAEGQEFVEQRRASPQEALEARELYAFVAELPGDFRDVVVAVDVAGLSYDEAARALRIPQGTVMSRLYRARQQLARRLR
jgi:RNA polymerase sigma-70 factor (ECF subfamily)